MKVLHLSNVIGEHKGGGVHEVVSNFYKYQRRLPCEPHIWYPGYPTDLKNIREDANIKTLFPVGNPKFGFFTELIKRIPRQNRPHHPNLCSRTRRINTKTFLHNLHLRGSDFGHTGKIRFVPMMELFKAA